MRDDNHVSIFSYLIYSVIAIVAGLFLTSLVIRTGTYFYAYLQSEDAPPFVQKTEAERGRMPAVQKIGAQPKSDFDITALAYIAADIETGEVFAESYGTTNLPVASITKLVTAVVAHEQIPESTLVTITQAMLNTEGASGKLKLGEKIKAGDLLYPLLMVSSNDASEALARTHGRVAFINLMNEKVKSWGALNTRFADPSGLSYNNSSNVRDLFTIVRAVYKQHPDLFSITKLKTKSVRGHTWTNPTHFLNMSSYEGGKNGYTDQANRTAASVFKVKDGEGNEHPVAIIVLRSGDRDADTLEILEYVEGLYK